LNCAKGKFDLPHSQSSRFAPPQVVAARLPSFLDEVRARFLFVRPFSLL